MSLYMIMWVVTTWILLIVTVEFNTLFSVVYANYASKLYYTVLIDYNGLTALGQHFAVRLACHDLL